MGRIVGLVFEEAKHTDPAGGEERRPAGDPARRTKEKPPGPAGGQK